MLFQANTAQVPPRTMLLSLGAWEGGDLFGAEDAGRGLASWQSWGASHTRDMLQRWDMTHEWGKNRLALQGWWERCNQKGLFSLKSSNTTALTRESRQLSRQGPF